MGALGYPRRGRSIVAITIRRLVVIFLRSWRLAPAGFRRSLPIAASEHGNRPTSYRPTWVLVHFRVPDGIVDPVAGTDGSIHLAYLAQVTNATEAPRSGTAGIRSFSLTA